MQSYGHWPLSMKITYLNWHLVVRVNCSFYFKIGACRHGDRCSRLHNKPTFSQTILLQNLYLNPQNTMLTAGGGDVLHRESS